MMPTRLSLFLIISLGSIITTTGIAQVRLPRLVRDSMILQRDSKINLWGWAAIGEKVTVTFARKNYKTITGKDGKWKITLPPMKAGGPYSINIDASNHVVLKDVLIGDVWICAGQSNMVHQMELHSVRYAEEIAKADYPNIRHFFVPNIANLQGVQEDLRTGSWKSANPVDVRSFSAIAYFFAKKLYDEYKVPVGLINTSWGGTPIEAWMSEDALKTFPAILSTAQKNKDTAYIRNLNNRPVAKRRSWPDDDPGIKAKWFAVTYQPKDWRPITVPGFWEDQGIKNLDGVVWYRREIELPERIVKSDSDNATLKVFLGRIVDADALYINGELVGSTSYMYPQRRYKLRKGLLKAGKNLFVVKVTNSAGKGGFVPDKPYQLISGNDTIDLRGEWHYKVAQTFAPFSITGNSGGIAPHNQPSALYNAMVAPLLNYAVKGFLWYQGESNTSRAAEYSLLQPAMISDWRNKWQLPAAPFLFVQLPGFGDMTYSPGESQWADFREAQTQSLAVANTAMVVAIDLGEWNDIHPDRKKEVGDRLALAAKKMVYGQTDIVASGPLYDSAVITGDSIIISFTNTGTGLTTSDNESLSDFVIAGADKKFTWAKARIEGNKIIVRSDEIHDPKFVRYAWADAPVNPNLINKEGLPASPFRTDK